VEEPGHDGGEAAEDSGASPSGETAFEISIDMSIMPNVPRTGRERLVVDLTQPDERFSNCVVVGPQDRVLHHTLEAEDLQAGYCHSEGLLTSAVPSEIRERVNVSQNLATYGWFCYELCTISVFWALSCIEMALWTKFIELRPGPHEIGLKRESVSGRGRDEGEAGMADRWVSQFYLQLPLAHDLGI
jgi:hypothetical protein